MIACCFSRLRVISSQKILKYLTKQLWVKCNLLLFRRVLFNGEIIAAEYGYQSSLLIEEKDIRHHSTITVASVSKFLVITTETIIVVGLLHTVDGLGLVKTLKQPAIEERHFCKHLYHLILTDFEHFRIAVKSLDVFLHIGCKTTLVTLLVLYGTVERGKEQVLKNGIVVVANLFAFRVKVLKNGVKKIHIKDLVWHKFFLLDEPHEHDSGYHADYLCFDILTIVVFCRCIVGEIHTCFRVYRPLIPVEQIFVELLGKRFNREGGRYITKRLLAFLQRAKLLNGRAATTPFSKKIGVSLGIGRQLLVVALLIEPPSLADVRETQHALVLAIAEHEGASIAHTTPIGSKHISNTTLVAFYVDIIRQFNFIYSQLLLIRQRNRAKLESFFCKAAIYFHLIRRPKDHFAKENIMEQLLPCFSIVS